MIDQTLQKLIEFLEQASPVFWQAVLKQTYSEAMSYLLWGVVLGVAFAVGYYLLGKWRKSRADDEDIKEIAAVCQVGVALIGGLITLNLFVLAVQWFYNPQFYAIRWIIQQLTQK